MLPFIAGIALGAGIVVAFNKKDAIKKAVLQKPLGEHIQSLADSGKNALECAKSEIKNIKDKLAPASKADASSTAN